MLFASLFWKKIEDKRCVSPMNAAAGPGMLGPNHEGGASKTADVLARQTLEASMQNQVASIVAQVAEVSIFFAAAAALVAGALAFR